MEVYDSIFNDVPSRTYALAKLALSLHKTPDEVRDMTAIDADLILAALDYENQKQNEINSQSST